MSAQTLERRFTSAEVAEALQLNVLTVRRKAFSGELDSEKVGREYRFTQAHIDAYLRGDRPVSKTLAKPTRNPTRKYRNK